MELKRIIFRVSHDYLVEQTELEEDLFTEIEPVRDAFLESFTLVTVECKCSHQLQLHVLHHINPQTCPKVLSWFKKRRPSKEIH